LRELGNCLTIENDRRLKQFVSKRCVNLISELLEYRGDVKENDHATDALRHSLPLAVEEKPFLYVVKVVKAIKISKAKIVTPNAVTAVE
jgi:hypothetical protein